MCCQSQFSKVASWLFFLVGLGLALPVTRAADASATLPPNPVLPNYFRNGKSPVDFFRTMLAMSYEERLAALADRSESQRRTLLAKVDEYQVMKPAEREWRLRLVELRLMLLPLLQAPASSRPLMLTNLPPDLKAIAQSRLEEWDRITDLQRQEILSDNTLLHYFMYRGRGKPSLTPEMLESINPKIAAQNRQVDASLRHWQGLSEADRADLADKVRHLFSLTSQDQMKFLLAAQPEDRLPLQMMLRRFARMSPDQRERCLEGFSKLARLTQAERQAFLLRAEQWQEMPPSQRNVWRSLVQSQPPLPPRP